MKVCKSVNTSTAWERLGIMPPAHCFSAIRSQKRPQFTLLMRKPVRLWAVAPHRMPTCHVLCGSAISCSIWCHCVQPSRTWQENPSVLKLICGLSMNGFCRVSMAPLPQMSTNLLPARDTRTLHVTFLITHQDISCVTLCTTFLQCTWLSGSTGGYSSSLVARSRWNMFAMSCVQQ